MRRTIWALPIAALAVTLVAVLWPASPDTEEPSLTGVFGAPPAEAALRRISIPFGFETVDLRDNHRQVDATGPISCDPGDRFRVDVTIVQETSEGTVEGWGHRNGQCTGDVQGWTVRVVARGSVPYEDGPAVGTWTFTTYRNGRVTDSATNADDPAVVELGAPIID